MLKLRNVGRTALLSATTSSLRLPQSQTEEGSPTMTEEADAATVIELDVENEDRSWEFECKAELHAHLRRLKSYRHARFDYYVELLRLIATLECYWRGLKPE